MTSPGDPVARDPQLALKLWSVLVHLLAIASGLALGIASYHWITGV
jgi:hypothetical protein